MERKDNVKNMINKIVPEQEILLPQRVLITSAGERIFDFEQELIGYLELIIIANAGEKITISYAKTSDNYSDFHTNFLKYKKLIEYSYKSNKQIFKLYLLLRDFVIFVLMIFQIMRV